MAGRGISTKAESTSVSPITGQGQKRKCRDEALGRDIEISIVSGNERSTTMHWHEALRLARAILEQVETLTKPKL